MNPDQNESALAPTAELESAPAPRDITSITEALLAATEQPNPAAGADASKPPVVKPGEEKPKGSAAETYERAMKAERKAQEDRKAAKLELEQATQQRAAAKAEAEKHAKDVLDARELARLVKDDPREFMRRVGISYEDFAKKLASGARVDPKVRELEERLDREKQERADAEKAQLESRSKEKAEADAKAEARAMEEFGVAVKAMPECGAVAWLLERDSDGVKAMLRTHAERVFQETGRVPTYEKAAQSLQDALLTDFDAMLSVASFRERAKAALAAEKPAVSAKNQKPARQAIEGKQATGDGPRTLTHDHVTAVGAGTSERELTREERYERMVSKIEAGLRA